MFARLYRHKRFLEEAALITSNQNFKRGLAIGALVSVLPFPLHYLSIVALGIYAALTLITKRSVLTIKSRAMELAGFAAMVGIAIFLPLKQLDQKVGPIHYDPMPLNELQLALSRDWHVITMPLGKHENEPMISFTTDTALSRRKVLEKLARETGGDLYISYCANGSTFLFGAHPSFTMLGIQISNRSPDSLSTHENETNRSLQTLTD